MLKIIFRGFAVLLLAATLTSQAEAKAAAKAGACYSTAELEAEQYLRLHSLLMVATVTCHTDSQDAALGPSYGSFTKTNIASLHAAETTLEQYYKVNYGGNGVAKLDDLRTKLGNEYGQEIANTSAQSFCDKNRDLPVTMAGSSEEAIKAKVSEMMKTEKSMHPLCSK